MLEAAEKNSLWMHYYSSTLHLGLARSAFRAILLVGFDRLKFPVILLVCFDRSEFQVILLVGFFQPKWGFRSEIFLLIFEGYNFW